jgi:hypothetical protein
MSPIGLQGFQENKKIKDRPWKFGVGMKISKMLCLDQLWFIWMTFNFSIIYYFDVYSWANKI